MPRLNALQIAVVVLLLVVGAVVLGGPVASYWKNRFVGAEQKAETNADDAEARGLEVEASKEQLDQTVRFHAQTDTLRVNIAPYLEEARVDPEGNEPLDRAAADRIRATDDILCGQRPSVCPGWQSPESRSQPGGAEVVHP